MTARKIDKYENESKNTNEHDNYKFSSFQIMISQQKDRDDVNSMDVGENNSNV